MKRILSLTLALLMIFACTPIVMAESEFEYVDYEGGIAITGYNGAGGVVTIPAEIDGKKVVAITGEVDKPSALHERTDITKVIISEGIETIGRYSFSKTTSIKEVVLPSTLKTIGFEAFRLTSITSIKIPEGVTEIQGGAFSNTKLTSIHIPKNAKLNGSIVPYCQSLKKITVDPENPYYAADGKFLYGKTGEKTAVDYAGGITDKRVVIPSYIYRIGQYCFRYNENIETVITPKNLVKINYWTFDGCTNLKEVYVTGKDTLVSNYIVSDNPSLIVYTNGKIDDFADGPRDTAENFIVKPYVEGMENTTFDYQVMSDGTIRLDKYTGTATDVIIPEEYRGYKVTWIMDGAFKSNKTIKSVHIPKNITFIAEAVFADCDNLTKFTTDNSIYGTTGTILYRKDNNRIIGYACGTKTSSLTIPSNIQTIAPCSFWGADNLKTVITNKGLKEIGYSAFKDCKNLKSIYVVDDKTFVDGYLFDGVTDKTVIYYNGTIEMQAGKVPCKIMPYTAGMEVTVTTTKPSASKTEKETVADGTTESTTETTTETTTVVPESTTAKQTEVNATVDSGNTETTGNDKNKATPITIGVVVVAVAGAVATGVTVTMKKKKK